MDPELLPNRTNRGITSGGGRALHAGARGASVILSTRCAVCGRRAALVEVLAPGELPEEYPSWVGDRAHRRDAYDRRFDLATWRFRYEGPGGGNGHGDTIDTDRAHILIEVFTPPISFDRLDEVDLYDDAAICRPCAAPYCYHHWNPSTTEYGHCPQGHGKSLDPHWHP
jgi:hypothetical protein